VSLAQQRVVRELGLEGALVVDVARGSAAERAGLRPTRQDTSGRLVLGDLIVAVNGEPVADAEDLTLRLEQRQIGETVRVTVDRNGRRQDLDVRLQALE
jgi:S1-C subfamily serine protease